MALRDMAFKVTFELAKQGSGEIGYGGRLKDG